MSQIEKLNATADDLEATQIVDENEMSFSITQKSTPFISTLIDDKTAAALGFNSKALAQI